MTTCRGCGAFFTKGHDEKQCEWIAQTLADRRAFTEKEAAYLDQVEALTEERDAALTQNAELVAMVENLKAAATSAYAEWNYSNDVYAGMQRLMRAIKATPTQHLRDVKAEAGRAGFVAGYLRAIHWPTSCDENHAGYNADQYAARVKAGEV